MEICEPVTFEQTYPQQICFPYENLDFDDSEKHTYHFYLEQYSKKYEEISAKACAYYNAKK